MAVDPRARRMTVSYEGGTVSGAQGLLQWLFGTAEPTWGAGSIGTTQLGRKRYKYGSKNKSLSASGEQVFLDCGEEGVYGVRVTGNVVDFIDKILPHTGTRVKRIYTRRGSLYGPTVANL